MEWKIYIKNSFLFVISLEEQFLLDYEATPSFHFPRDKREECTKSSHLGETADKFLLSILGSRDRSLPVKQFAGNEAVISWTNGSYRFSFLTGLNSDDEGDGEGEIIRLIRINKEINEIRSWKETRHLV